MIRRGNIGFGMSTNSLMLVAQAHHELYATKGFCLVLCSPSPAPEQHTDCPHAASPWHTKLPFLLKAL